MLVSMLGYFFTQDELTDVIHRFGSIVGAYSLESGKA